MGQDEALRAQLARALQGDPRQQQLLARMLLPAIQRELAYVLANQARGSGRDPRQDLADLVQDVLITLYENDLRELRRWDPERGRSLESYVRMVARRRARRTFRGWRGNPWAGESTDPEDMEAFDDEVGLVDELEQRDALAGLLQRLGEQMSDRDRRLFEALFVQERDPAEVCTEEDISRGALNAWRYRMRKLARELAATETNAPVSSSDATDTRGVRG